MKEGKLYRRRWFIPAALAGGILLFAVWQLPQLREKERASDLRMYDYRDTRRLVNLTARAADLVEERGEEAFKEFNQEPERWSLEGNSYLYIYGLDGVNLFHGGYPHLAGENLIDFTDLNGKKVTQMIIDQLENHRSPNPHGWSHYLWVPPGSLDGAWKSSCNFGVAMPDGRRVFVGSGIDAPLQEREFYRIVVDEGAELLEEKGKAGLSVLKDPGGPFTIHDKGVFVIDSEGQALIDPGLYLGTPRNLYDYQDLTGRRPMKELSDKLKSAQTAWVITLKQGKAGSKPVKEGIYGHRATMDGEEVIVGAISPLPRPAWMR
ncbi:MAG: cache domain-containing protein [PVC group bacterium]